MSVGQAKFFVVGAFVVMVSGFGVAVEGHPLGWLLVALGGVNTVIGILNLRKTQRRLSGVRRFRDRA
jgi:hypothetical protein